MHSLVIGWLQKMGLLFVKGKHIILEKGKGKVHDKYFTCLIRKYANTQK
jgi:hypothetical protein